MGCARPTNGWMRKRSGSTIAFFARNSWKVSIPYVVAWMPFWGWLLENLPQAWDTRAFYYPTNTACEPPHQHTQSPPDFSDLPLRCADGV